MASEGSASTRPSPRSFLRSWAVEGAVLIGLVGVPVVVFFKTQFDVLSAVGVGRIGFALVVMSPGLLLGALSLVVMLGID